jgi:hypothetical protein
MSPVFAVSYVSGTTKGLFRSQDLTAAEHLALSNIGDWARGAPWCNECAEGLTPSTDLDNPMLPVASVRFQASEPRNLRRAAMHTLVRHRCGQESSKSIGIDLTCTLAACIRRSHSGAVGRTIHVKGSHHFIRHTDGRATVVPVHAGDAWTWTLGRPSVASKWRGSSCTSCFMGDSPGTTPPLAALSYRL